MVSLRTFLLLLLSFCSAIGDASSLNLRSLVSSKNASDVVYDVCKGDFSSPIYYTMELTLTSHLELTCDVDELNNVAETFEKALDEFTLEALEKEGLTVPAIVMQNSKLCEAEESVNKDGAIQRRFLGQMDRKLGFSFVYRGGGFCR